MFLKQNSCIAITKTYIFKTKTYVYLYIDEQLFEITVLLKKEIIIQKHVVLTQFDTGTFCIYVFITIIVFFWCFNATFITILAISWRPVLVVEEAGVTGENHRPWASNW